MTGPARRAWVWPLAVTLLMQTESAFLTRMIPVIGPVLTEAAQVTPEQIGYIASMGSLGTMWFLMAGGAMLKRLGPVRLLQLGALVGAAATLLVTIGIWPVMMAASLLIGVGYGPSPPAGSDILARTAPKGARALIFSVKQSAVPLGGAVAGLIIPPLTLLYDWRVALAVAAVLALGAALAVQPLRARIDATRDRDAPLNLAAFVSPRSFAAPFRAMALAPSLWPLTYAGFCFAIAQGTLFAFLVTYLTTEIGVTLAVAGTLFATTQVVGVFARVIMGWVADRLGSGVRALILLSIGSTVMMLVMAAIAPGWSYALMMTAAALAGFAVASWNGVYLSEVAQAVPSERVGDATSGSTFFTFVGYVVGPSVFATMVSAIGSYGLTFALIAAVPLSAGLVLFSIARKLPPR
jgi:MFS family permease